MAWLNVIVYLSLFLLATTNQPEHNRHEKMDNLKMFSAFPHAVAVLTPTNDSAITCSSLTRTRLDSQAKTVSMVWRLKGGRGHPRRSVIFDVSFGETPGQGTFVVNKDTAHNYTASYDYCDYATCAVSTFPFEGRQLCILWVKPALKRNVPEHCLEKYEETCDQRVSLNERSFC